MLAGRLFSNNEVLHSLFEGDIMPRVFASPSVKHSAKELRSVINVEVDGPRHRRVKKNRFNRLRDVFLQSN